MTISCVAFQQSVGNGAEGPGACKIDVSHLEIGDVVVLYTTALAAGGGEGYWNQTTGGSQHFVLNPFGKTFSDASPLFTNVGVSYATMNADALTGFSDGDGRIKYIGWGNYAGNFFGITMAMWTFRGGAIASGVQDALENDTNGDDALPWTKTLTAPALTAYQARFVTVFGRSGWSQAGPSGVYMGTNLSPIGDSRLTTDNDPLTLWNGGFGAETAAQTHTVTWAPYGQGEELTSVDATVTLPGWTALMTPFYKTAQTVTLTFASPIEVPVPDTSGGSVYAGRRITARDLPYHVNKTLTRDV